MLNFSLLLRCLIVVAFCLDGSAMAWQTSAMAVGAVHHAHAVNEGHEGADHGSDGVAAMDCEHTAPTAPTEPVHDDCDCGDTGCDCACSFVTLALATGVPVVDTFWIGFVQAPGHLATVAQGVPSSLFRPPIG